ncbi:MAG TPA: TetR family transcriptional regulator [Steroidobacteraceae bacterium]|jgi:AcrR family transcriptional regulator
MTQKTDLPINRPKRPRNAAATREAILRSALAAFSRYGYDGVGVREIAKMAGVTGVLVNRYFGSKEQLFAATVEIICAGHSVFEGDSTTLATRLAAKIMSKTEPIDALLLILRSAPNPRAAEILRENIARHFERPMKASLSGPNASERAAMILALVVGFKLFHNVIGSKGLVHASRASLSRRLAMTLQGLIDSPSGGAVRTRRIRSR